MTMLEANEQTSSMTIRVMFCLKSWMSTVTCYPVTFWLHHLSRILNQMFFVQWHVSEVVWSLFLVSNSLKVVKLQSASFLFFCLRGSIRFLSPLLTLFSLCCLFVCLLVDRLFYARNWHQMALSWPWRHSTGSAWRWSWDLMTPHRKCLRGLLRFKDTL